MTDDESEHLVSAGMKLVVARKAVKLTQEQLAKELRLSSRAIRSLEKGERKARHETQAKIHRVLGIDLYGTLDEFYDEILGTGSDPRETAELQARPTMYFIRAGVLPAVTIILIGVALAVGLTLLGRIL